MNRVLCFLLFLLQSYEAFCQLIYFVRPRDPNIEDHIFYFSAFDVENCKDSIIFQIKNVDDVRSLLDLAVCPDGEFYVVTQSSSQPYYQIARINMQDSSLVYLTDTPPANSLTCDAFGQLWLAPFLYSLDPHTGQFHDYGFIGYFLAGDVTFINGNLYGTTVDNELVEIDPNDLSATHVVYQYPLSNDIQAYGVVSDVISCDSTTVYISTTNLGVSSTIDSVNAIYIIDPVAQTTTFVCDVPHAMWGCTTANEYLASDCTLTLDLDSDDSSGAEGVDWDSPPLCFGSVYAIADTDALWRSGYRTDSITLRFLSPPPDASFEYLSGAPAGGVSIAGSGSQSVTILRTANLSVPIANQDFQTALRSIEWHDDALTRTPGTRTIEVIAHCSAGRSDTAYARLHVPALQVAGLDTVISVCQGAAAFQLELPGMTAGGSWSATQGGNGWLNPSVDSAGYYAYVVENGSCPADTAWAQVALLALPSFSLGQDIGLCQGDSLILTAPGLSGWQDGTLAVSYTAASAGLYWAEFQDSAGCPYRDSVIITFYPVQQGFSSENLCAGQSWDWNGESYDADTVVCRVFSGQHGCDSTHCLTLNFFYPSVQLDTVICAGQQLNWNGLSYNQSGMFQDTLLLGACRSIAQIHLTVMPPDTTWLYPKICQGDSLTFGGEVLRVSGQYTFTSLNAAGCEGVSLVELQVLDSLKSSLEKTVCPGEIYHFGGADYSIPGSYLHVFSGYSGCDSLVTLHLSNFPAPGVSISGDTVLCPGGEAELQASGDAGNYQWSSGQLLQTITVQTAGIYSVTVSDPNGCTGSAWTHVLEDSPVFAQWDTIAPQCHDGNDGMIVLQNISGGIPPYSFRLNDGELTQTPSFEALSPGLYSIEVSDQYHCSTAFPAYVPNPPGITIQLPATVRLEAGDTYSIQLSVAPAGDYDYIWTPASGLSCADCANPVAMAIDSQSYTVRVTSLEGCTGEASLFLLVSAGTGIYAPQAFSPNDDRTNDYFTLYTDPGQVLEIERLQVFDRWGELLYSREHFTGNNENEGWDGTFRGQKVLPGVYVWQARLRMSDGSSIYRNGEVTVIR